MSHIVMPGSPMCPLCFKKMREVFTDRGHLFVCTEAECMISISSQDPAVGKWYEPSEPPLCPKDGTPMRLFFRVYDGFIKAQCPTCRKQGKITQVMKGKVEHMDPRWSAEV